MTIPRLDVRLTPYGPAALDALRSAVAAAKSGNPLAPVTLVVPTELVGVTARRALARDTGTGRPGVAGLFVVTPHRLAESLVGGRLSAAGRRPLTGTVLAAAVRTQLADDPGLFAPVASHVGTVQAVAAAHRLLRPVPSSVLDRLSAEGGILAADVVRLHRSLRVRLRAGWYDPDDLLDEAATALADRSAEFARYGSVVTFLLQELGPAQRRFLEAVAAAAPATVIAGVTGDPEADRGVFDHLGSHPGSHVAEPMADRVVHATDPDDEVRAVVREVVAALADRPGHRIAVLFGSADPYARLLHEHLQAAEVKIHGRGVRPTAERLIGRTILRLLSLPHHDFRRDEVLATLADGAVRRNGQRVPAAQWERISREAGVIRGADWERLAMFAARLRDEAEQERAQPEPREWYADRAIRHADAAADLLAFVHDLRARLASIDTAATWADAADVALRLWTDLLGGDDNDHLPDEEQRAADRIKTTLHGLRGFDGVAGTPSLEAVREIVELELADEVDRVGRIGVGVHVGPISDGVGLDVDLVVILGLAEGLCPGRQRDDPLLPDEVRALSRGALPTLRERLARERRMFLAALAGGRARILTFPRGDQRQGGERVPSRWLLPSLRHLTGDPTIQATDWAPAARKVRDLVMEIPSHAAAVETVAPGSRHEWRLRTVTAHDHPEAGLPHDIALHRALETRRARYSERFTRFDGNLTGAPGLPDPTAATTVSPTALEEWTRCPHAYLLHYVLGVSPVEDPEELVRISPLERGSVVHRIYERFLQEAIDAEAPAPEQKWSLAQRQRLTTIAAEELDAAEARGVTGFALLWQRDREAIRADVERFLDADDERRAAGRLVPIATELPFGRNGRPPVEFDLGDGRVLRLRGQADRVDRRPDGGLVVCDYKTGRSRYYAELSETDPVDHGHRLQLPVYALAARQVTGTGDVRVRAEYWFATRVGRFATIGYEVSQQALELTRHALRVIADGIRSGIFPARPLKQSGAYECAYCDVVGHESVAEEWERKRVAPELAPYLGLIFGPIEPADATDRSVRPASAPGGGR